MKIPVDPFGDLLQMLADRQTKLRHLEEDLAQNPQGALRQHLENKFLFALARIDHVERLIGKEFRACRQEKLCGSTSIRE